MSKDVYIAVRMGIYMQGIIGVYTTLDLAKEACLEAKRDEPDDYHDFYVYKHEVDSPPCTLETGFVEDFQFSFQLYGKPNNG